MQWPLDAREHHGFVPRLPASSQAVDDGIPLESSKVGIKMADKEVSISRLDNKSAPSQQQQQKFDSADWTMSLGGGSGGGVGGRSAGRGASFGKKALPPHLSGKVSAKKETWFAENGSKKQACLKERGH